MRYLPKSPTDREAMLKEIGVASIDALFETIPAEYQLTRDLKIPRQHSESEIIERFRGFAENNATGYASALYISSAVPGSVLIRSNITKPGYAPYLNENVVRVTNITTTHTSPKGVGGILNQKVFIIPIWAIIAIVVIVAIIVVILVRRRSGSGEYENDEEE